ncbi:methionyl-tRNA formyltransferase [Taibaiella helva]|uniref:methionyl-tRNA formyltransferase n=1 Tax=Taibaiella helva TaxID=2301235 RepID=UPI001E38784F|nr:methionyl-tRNA formyltransferase [Taibaiella helva]
MVQKNFPRIVFMGTPDFAVASLKALVEHGYPVVAVVTAPDKPAGRGMQLKASAVKEYALSQALPVLQPEKLRNPAFLEALKGYRADLQVVVAFRMLPEMVWNMPPMGTLNVHASLLPQYRGAAPINWAIINGERETGVTTFRLKHEIDTGDILLQEKIAILPEDNIGTLYEKLMHRGAALLLQTVDGLAAGTIKEQPQASSGDLKHAPKIFREDGLIRWEQPAEAIHNLVRGLSPVPAAYTQLSGKQLKVYATSFNIAAHGQAPGHYETDGKTLLRFAAADGWVNILDLQYEGKKRMPVAEFLRGFRIAAE